MINISKEFEPIRSPHAGDDYFENLDYALLKLYQPIGDRQISKVEGQDAERGHIELGATTNVKVNDELMLFSHPNGKAVKYSSGNFLGYMENGGRVRYDASSDYGSSGGPIMSPRFNCIALHAARSAEIPPVHNVGVPIELILADIENKSPGLLG